MNAVLKMWALYKAKNFSINCVKVKPSIRDLLFELIHRENKASPSSSLEREMLLSISFSEIRLGAD